MLIKQLLAEALSATEPSKESIALSKASIKKVQQELDEQRAKYEEGITKENKRIRDVAIERVKTAKAHMELALQYHDEFLPGFNAIKKKIDAAHKANDAEKYSDALKELKTFIADKKIPIIHNRMIKELARDPKRLKVSGPYQQLLRSKLQQMRDVVDALDKEKKYVGKSDEDKAATAKRSAAMRARWGGSL